MTNRASHSIAKELLIAFVGMPGSGKSQAVSYLSAKNIPFVRFGQLTDDVISKEGLVVSEETERHVREKLRKDHGMAAYAKLSEAKIRKCLLQSTIVLIDGMYSWEEYVYIRDHFEKLIVVHIYAERKIRYNRLSTRAVRPLTYKQAEERDFSEIEKLNKGGPIAIADYLIDNTSLSFSEFEKAIDILMEGIGINK